MNFNFFSSTIIKYLFVRGYSCYLTRWYIKLIVSVVIYIDISQFLWYIEGWKPDCFSFPPDFMLPMMKTICLHPTPNSALALDLMRIMLINFFFPLFVLFVEIFSWTNHSRTYGKRVLFNLFDVPPHNMICTFTRWGP